MSFMTRITTAIRKVWRRVPTAIRSGWITAWVVFVGAMLSTLTGLLPVLANAISTKDFEPFYDSLSAAVTVSLSAALAFIAGLVNVIWRWIHPIAAAYQTAPPAE